MNPTTKRAVTVAATLIVAILLGLALILMHLPEGTIAPVAFGIALLCALMLIVVPRIDKTYGLVPWAKIALWMLSFVIVMWCAIGLLQMQIPWYPSRPQVRGFIVSHLWAFSTGLMVGITVTLLLLGAFSKRYDRSP
jgi:hypothetical protein